MGLAQARPNYICNRTSFRIYAYFCNLTYTVQIFLTFHVIAAKTTQAQLLRKLARPRSLASTACEGLATVHARVSSGTMIRPTIDELGSAHREIYTGAGKSVYERLVLHMHPCKTQL